MAALLTPSTKNQYLFISSVETTQNDILAALEAESGAWTVKKTTSSEEIAAGREMLGKGDMEGAFKLVRAGVFSDLPVRANYAKDEALANEALGLKGDTVQASVRRALQ